jgi:hypothetical protein
MNIKDALQIHWEFSKLGVYDEAIANSSFTF